MSSDWRIEIWFFLVWILVVFIIYRYVFGVSLFLLVGFYVFGSFCLVNGLVVGDSDFLRD